jgi:hypothetical protein
MGDARQLWLAAVSRPGPALHEFHSGVIAASTAPAVHSVSAAAYLWIPMAVGAGLVVSLVLLTGLIGVPYVEFGVAQTAGLFSERFWQARFYASAAWTFGDSGATNITAVATALAAILGSGTVLTSVFPTIDLNPFIIMNIACGVMVAASPILFGIANVVVKRSNPSVPGDATLMLHADASVTVPSGGSIALPGGAVVTNAKNGPEKARIKPGGTISVPPGSRITVSRAATMAMLSGAAVAISPGATLTIDTATLISSSDLAPPQASPAGGHQSIVDWPARAAVPDALMMAGDLISVTEGAVATATGTAGIWLGAATIVGPGGGGMALKPGTAITLPPAPHVMGIGSVLLAAALTIFGIGTEIGLLVVLAAHYSPAGHAGRVAAVVISAAVAAGLVIYGATSIRSLAEPSSGARTSYTL